MTNDRDTVARLLAAALAAGLVAAPAALAQPLPPRIGYVYPAGARQGETVEVRVGGQYLHAEAMPSISGPGVQAAAAEYAKPLTQKEVNELREKVQELLKGKKDVAILKEVADIRARLLAFSRRPNPTIAETLTVRVTVAAEAAPGARELRVTTPLGVSNPLVFCIGQLPEFREEVPKGGEARPDLPAPRFPGRAQAPGQEPEAAVTLPAVLNGQILPGDADRFRFEARKGQRLVVAASARRLIPYLADAVPGWFQATLALYDADGQEVAYNDDFRFHPDPVLCFEVPRDGAYVLEVRDAIYRGREDFVYRVAVGELPFVTSVFPLGGRAGARTDVEVSGWNLPATHLTQDNTDAAPGLCWVSVRRGGLESNRAPFAVDALPECLEKEPNDGPAAAQPVRLPIIVNGRTDRPGDWDVFRFDGRAGAEIVAEVQARRLDSPLDSVLRVTDAAGRQLAFNDDHEDKAAGLHTHHADSYVRLSLPAGGTYYVHLGDAQQAGGAAYGYRLRIGPPRPDFELRVAPSSISLRSGSSAPLTVYALRKDGFAGEIGLALQGAPAGLVLGGGRIPAGQDCVRVTLTAAAPLDAPVSLRLEGRAAVQGREVVRPTVPAEDMMQAFAYRHLVPAEELKVAVGGRGRGRPPVRILGASPVRIPAGGTARVKVGMPTRTPFGDFDFELNEPPDGIALREAAPDGLRTDLILVSDAAKVKPGLAGNLIVNVYLTRTAPPPAPSNPPRGTPAQTPAPAEPAPAKAPTPTQPPPAATAAPLKATAPLAALAARTAPARRVLVSTLPAIPFEVVAP